VKIPMTQEKRQTPRKRIGRLLYAELGPDNGSILLDISEQGCSFQAIAPVRERQVRFTISVGDGRKVTGEARVAWVDATAKIGGLRFLGDSPELKEQIRSWMELTAAPLSTLKAGEERDSEAKRRRKKLREEGQVQAGTVEAGRSTQLPASLNRMPTAATERPSAREFSMPSVQAQAIHRAVLQTPARNRTMIGPAFATIALAAVLFTMMAYHQDLGRMVMGLGASIAGEPQNPPASPPDPTSEPGATPGATSNAVAPVGAPEASGQSRGVESETVSGKEQLTPAAAGGPTGRPAPATNVNLTEDVPALWALVEGGDTRAELTLADRYIRGEGVTQSCAQARVLLEAAVKRGSDQAKRKLDELPQAGCR
jgi:PilZ domain